MFCNICGKEMLEGANFCNMCGTKAVLSVDNVQIEQPMSDAKKALLITGAAVIGSILAFGIIYFTLALILYI